MVFDWPIVPHFADAEHYSRERQARYAEFEKWRIECVVAFRRHELSHTIKHYIPNATHDHPWFNFIRLCYDNVCYRMVKTYAWHPGPKLSQLHWFTHQQSGWDNKVQVSDHAESEDNERFYAAIVYKMWLHMLKHIMLHFPRHKASAKTVSDAPPAVQEPIQILVLGAGTAKIARKTLCSDELNSLQDPEKRGFKIHLVDMSEPMMSAGRHKFRLQAIKGEMDQHFLTDGDRKRHLETEFDDVKKLMEKIATCEAHKTMLDKLSLAIYEELQLFHDWKGIVTKLGRLESPEPDQLKRRKEVKHRLDQRIRAQSIHTRKVVNDLKSKNPATESEKLLDSCLGQDKMSVAERFCKYESHDPIHENYDYFHAASATEHRYIVKQQDRVTIELHELTLCEHNHHTALAPNKSDTYQRNRYVWEPRRNPALLERRCMFADRLVGWFSEADSNEGWVRGDHPIRGDPGYESYPESARNEIKMTIIHEQVRLDRTHAIELLHELYTKLQRRFHIMIVILMRNYLPNSVLLNFLAAAHLLAKGFVAEISLHPNKGRTNPAVFWEPGTKDTSPESSEPAADLARLRKLHGFSKNVDPNGPFPMGDISLIDGVRAMVFHHTYEYILREYRYWGLYPVGKRGEPPWSEVGWDKKLGYPIQFPCEGMLLRKPLFHIHHSDHYSFKEAEARYTNQFKQHMTEYGCTATYVNYVTGLFPGFTAAHGGQLGAEGDFLIENEEKMAHLREEYKFPGIALKEIEYFELLTHDKGKPATETTPAIPVSETIPKDVMGDYKLIYQFQASKGLKKEQAIKAVDENQTNLRVSIKTEGVEVVYSEENDEKNYKMEKPRPHLQRPCEVRPLHEGPAHHTYDGEDSNLERKRHMEMVLAERQEHAIRQIRLSWQRHYHETTAASDAEAATNEQLVSFQHEHEWHREGEREAHNQFVRYHLPPEQRDQLDRVNTATSFAPGTPRGR